MPLVERLNHPHHWWFTQPMLRRLWWWYLDNAEARG